MDAVAVGWVSVDMTYRLGWVSYWICLVLAGMWAVFFAYCIPWSVNLASLVIFAAPSLLLYGLGRAIRYVLAGD